MDNQEWEIAKSSLNLEDLYFPILVRWLKQTEEKISQWMITAISMDKVLLLLFISRKKLIFFLFFFFFFFFFFFWKKS